MKSVKTIRRHYDVGSQNSTCLIPPCTSPHHHFLPSPIHQSLEGCETSSRNTYKLTYFHPSPCTLAHQHTSTVFVTHPYPRSPTALGQTRMLLRKRTAMRVCRFFVVHLSLSMGWTGRWRTGDVSGGHVILLPPRLILIAE